MKRESGLPDFFSIASRDDLWLRRSLVESRLMHGVARQNGQTMEASDARDEALIRACDEAAETARPIIAALHDARVRMVVRAIRQDDFETVETTISISIDGVSIVTAPGDALADHALLRTLLQSRPASSMGMSIGPLPIVWRNGSAAVLLHEAVGHASEHDATPVPWPSWLAVEAPLVPRRETFRDVPLPRMTHVMARQTCAPFVLPDERIDVHLIAGGAFDPVTDEVTIEVAISSAGPFTIRRSRSEIAAALQGATGDPIRYPGVICSREGQELYVASHAPVMITGPLT